MEKYKIQIIKESDNKDLEPLKETRISIWDRILFDGYMNSDDAIEILKHLFDLQQRDRDEKTVQKEK